MSLLEKPVDVFVPVADSPFQRLVQPLSGMVGAPVPDPHGSGEDRVLVYFQGPTPSVNVVTFADRCNIAHGRYAMSYPTTAKALAPAGEVARVGTFHRDECRVEIEDGLSLALVAKWLGLWNDGAIDTDALHRELRAGDPWFTPAGRRENSIRFPLGSLRSLAQLRAEREGDRARIDAEKARLESLLDREPSA